jgi:cytoskeletal protein CcmA (bactofilin family)
MSDTIIGSSIVIDGEITGSAPVIVHGTIKGKIGLEASILVESGARVEADIEVDQLEVSGQVTGNVHARERVEIHSDGRMIGDVRSPRILIADGAGFKGHIDMDVE